MQKKNPSIIPDIWNLGTHPGQLLVPGKWGFKMVTQ